MKYTDFKIILEYDRSKTAANFSAAIQNRAKTDSYLKSKNTDPVAAVMEAAEEADPTSNKQYVTWIVRQYVKNNLKYEDIYKLRDKLDMFVKTKGQHKRLGINSDINQYDWRTISDLAAQLGNTELSEPQEGDGKVADADILYNGPLGMLSVPKTKQASCELGRGTDWCTARTHEEKNMFGYYSKFGPLYIWHDKKRKGKFQFHFESGQFMDSSDNPLTAEDAKYFMQENPITSKLFKKNENKLIEVLDNLVGYTQREPESDDDYYNRNDKSLELQTQLEDMAAEANFDFILWSLSGKELAYYYKKAAEYLRPNIRNIILADDEKRKAFESAYIKNPKDAQMLAHKLYREPTPHLEDIIAQNGRESYLYAFNTLNQQRFKKGEPEIAKDTWAALMYAQKILKRPWPEGEPAIKQSPATWRVYQQFFNLAETVSKNFRI